MLRCWAARPRPAALTVTCCCRNRPLPWLKPSQRRPVTSKVTSHPGQLRPDVISTVSFCRARAITERAAAADTWDGGVTTTTSNPSINAATAATHSMPGSGTSAAGVRASPRTATLRG